MTDKPKELRFEWKCPKCSAPANDHGDGGAEKCRDRHAHGGKCSGFLCECVDDGLCDETSDVHGELLSDKCSRATCYHCGWSGTYPKMPPKANEWEKKALKAGWTPPAARAKELGVG